MKTLFAGAIAGAFVAGAFALPATAADKDEFLETLDSAKAYYEEGDISELKKEVEYLSQLVGKLRLSALEKLLPDALDGWTAADVEGSAVGGAMFGGATTVSRVYSKDGKDVKLEIMGDNPAISQMLAMYLGNPAIVAQSGAEVMRVGREQAIYKDDELQLSAGGWIVKYSGSASKEDKVSYAEATDLKALKDF